MNALSCGDCDAHPVLLPAPAAAFLVYLLPLPSRPAGVSEPALGSPVQLIEHLLALAESDQLRWRLEVGGGSAGRGLVGSLGHG